MRMRAHDGIDAPGGQPVRPRFLLPGMPQPVFLSPMRQGDDEIRTPFPGPGDERRHLFLLHHGDPRTVEGLRPHVVPVGEIDESDADPLPADQRRMQDGVLGGIARDAGAQRAERVAYGIVDRQRALHPAAAFVQDVVVGEQGDIQRQVRTDGPGIGIGRGEGRIPGVRRPGQGEFHVGHGDVRRPHRSGHVPEESGIIVFQLGTVHHDVADETQRERVGGVDRTRRRQGEGPIRPRGRRKRLCGRLRLPDRQKGRQEKQEAPDHAPKGSRIASARASGVSTMRHGA